MFPCECDKATCCKSISPPLGLPVIPGTKTCRLLDPDTNRCTIYATRPLICRVDMYFLEHSPTPTLEDWYAMNEKACRCLTSK